MYKAKLGYIYIKLTKKKKLNIKMAGEQMRFQQHLKKVSVFWIHECELGVHSIAWLLNTEIFFRHR